MDWKRNKTPNNTGMGKTKQRDPKKTTQKQQKTTSKKNTLLNFESLTIPETLVDKFLGNPPKNAKNLGLGRKAGPGAENFESKALPSRNQIPMKKKKTCKTLIKKQ